MQKTFTTNFIITFLLITMLWMTCDAQSVRNTAIKISDNGRYFIGEDGKPFFWQGDTEWELFHVFSVSDAETILTKRRDQGFNVIQVMATGLYPEVAAMVGMKPLVGMQAWLNNNPFTPNENYFKRMDSIVSVAKELNMLLVVGVYHAGDNDKGRITIQNAKPWAKWLAQRYKNAKNIAWSMYPHAIQSSAPVILATVQGIIEGDSGTHFITMHPDPSPTSSSFMHNESWLSFNTLQTWSSDSLNYIMVAADYARTPVKPVVNGEARYEEESGTTPFDIRRGAYWSYLAGGFYSYGHGSNWLSPQTWQNWYDSPGANQMKALRSIFESVDWWNLIPDQSIFVDGIKGNAAARSANGDWILAYLTSNASVTLRLDNISASSVTGCWIDPLTGAKKDIGTFRTSGTNIFSLPDGWKDGVLLFKK